MNKDIQKIVERANKALGSNSSRGTLPYSKWLEKELIKAEQQLKNCNLQNVRCSLHIDFAVYLTGHDRETIEQMFNDWRQ